MYQQNTEERLPRLHFSYHRYYIVAIIIVIGFLITIMIITNKVIIISGRILSINHMVVR